MTYTDDKGYLRDTYGKLIHRQIAYEQIYRGSKEYKLPFREYIVHHIDTDPKNNNVKNLMLLTKEEHNILHNEQKNKLKKFKSEKEIRKFLEEHKEDNMDYRNAMGELEGNSNLTPADVQIRLDGENRYLAPEEKEGEKNQGLETIVESGWGAFEIFRFLAVIVCFAIGLYVFLELGRHSWDMKSALVLSSFISISVFALTISFLDKTLSG